MADAPETTTTTTTQPDIEVKVTETDQLGDEGKKALDAERRARREAEKAHKAATAELDKLREQTSTEQEKALTAAKAEGRTEALREAGIRLVDAEVRAAAAGRNVDTDALLEGLDRTRFIDAEGNPDSDAIKAWVDRVAPAQEEPQTPGFPSLEQGTRSNAPLALGSDPLLNSLKRMTGTG